MDPVNTANQITAQTGKPFENSTVYLWQHQRVADGLTMEIQLRHNLTRNLEELMDRRVEDYARRIEAIERIHKERCEMLMDAKNHAVNALEACRTVVAVLKKRLAGKAKR